MGAVEIPNQLLACLFVIAGSPGSWAGSGIAQVRKAGVGDWEITLVEEAPSSSIIGSDTFGQNYLMGTVNTVGDSTITVEQSNSNKKIINVKTFTAGSAADKNFSVEVRQFSGVPVKFNTTV